MLQESLLHRILNRVIVDGAIVVEYPSGRAEKYGRSSEVSDDTPNISITSNRTIRRLIANPAYAFPNEYVKGNIRISDQSLHNVIAVLFKNIDRYRASPGARVRQGFDSFSKAIRAKNTVFKSGVNVRRHYDIDDRLYRLFLDTDMQYSCGFFENSQMSLEEAQDIKKQRIIAKLNMKSNMRILDIGCGWGGLALSIARQYTDARVVGVTLSPGQLQVARRRAMDAGLSNRVKFQLTDYRDIKDKFDRIVSVGMFEHVGPRDYLGFFKKIDSLLTANGLALLHTIGRTGVPQETNPWIRKHIFPGGYIPALSEITPAVEKSGLITGDVEILRLHYAQTIRHWFNRFKKNEDLAQSLYGDEFCRLWSFYLASSEQSFRYLDHVVFQIQLLKSFRSTPIVRDYMSSAADIHRPEMSEKAPSAIG